MALSNHERVGKVLELLNQGLTPFVEREMRAHYRERWPEVSKAYARQSQSTSPKSKAPTGTPKHCSP